MPRTHKKNANPDKYVGKAYLTYNECIGFLGISLSTLVRYIADEKIQTHKFYRDKKRYLAIEDVTRIEKLIQAPWKRTSPTTHENTPTEQEKTVEQAQVAKRIEEVVDKPWWEGPEQKKESKTEESQPEAA